mgnify:CR=1 FL=1
MFAIVESHEDSYWELVQEHFCRLCSAAHALLDCGVVLRVVYLQDCGRCVLNRVRLIQRGGLTHLHPHVQKAERGQSFRLREARHLDQRAEQVTGLRGTRGRIIGDDIHRLHVEKSFLSQTGGVAGVYVEAMAMMLQT